MDASPVDIVLFGALAPLLGVVLFWAIQLLFIESEKQFLRRIQSRHDAFCRFTNFIGLLFQSICHVFGLTLTRRGVGEFKLSVEKSHVMPKRERKGFRMWIANSFLFIGPFIIPPAILVLYFLLMVEESPLLGHSFDIALYTFGGQLIVFGEVLYAFSADMFRFLSSADLFNPVHLLFVILLLLLGLGTRPSYIVEKSHHKVDIFYDLRNIWSHMREEPLYVAIIGLCFYCLFYLSLLLNNSWYVYLISLIGCIAITAIVALVLAHLLLFLIIGCDHLKSPRNVLPYIILPISYISTRIIFYICSWRYDLQISLLVMLSMTAVTVLLLKRRDKKPSKTDRLKPKKRMLQRRLE